MAQKSIKTNAIINTIRTISMMIFPLITFPYTSRILGPEGTGKIGFAQSFVSYFVLLAAIGIPLYGVREIARVRDNQDALSETAQELFVLNLISSIFFTVVLILLIFVNGKLHAEKELFFVVSFTIILSSLGMEWLYQGLEQYTYITIRSIVFSTISTISIFIFIQQKDDYIIYAAISVVASVGSSVLNFYNARHIIFKNRTVNWNFKRHIKPLSVVYLMNFIISIYVQLDTVMLGFLSSDKYVGYYTAGIKLNKMMLGLVASLSNVLLPRLSYYIANNLKEEFNKMLKRSMEVIWMLCLPMVAAIVLLNREIITFFAGLEYLPATSSIVITAPIILFIGLSNIFGLQILYPLGKDKQVVYSVGVGAVVAFILNLSLIPYFQHIGAAYATLISELCVLIFMLFLIPKEYKILLPGKSIIRYFIATTGMISVIVLIRYLDFNIWLFLSIVVPLGVVIYFSLLLIMKDETIKDVYSKIKNKVNYV